MKIVSVVVPVYRSKNTIVELDSRIRRTFEETDLDFEIIYVDDRGEDGTREIIHEQIMPIGKARILVLTKNYGQSNANLAGISVSMGDFVVTIDDDLQCPPEEIPRMIKLIESGFDAVYATPSNKKQGILRRLGSKFVNWAYRNSLEISHDRSSFKAMTGDIAKRISAHKESGHIVDGLIFWYTKNTTILEIEFAKRKYGRSNYSLRVLINQAQNIITTYSSRPLQFASWSGFLVSSTAFIMSLLYFLIALMNSQREVPGWASVFVAITFLSSIQLLILGIIAEYISRIHSVTKNEPAYVISEQFEG